MGDSIKKRTVLTIAERLKEESTTFEKALPCPFNCVGERRLSKKFGEPIQITKLVDGREAESLYGSWWVECVLCLCRGPFGSWPQEAIIGWNRRGVIQYERPN